jgi:hypothetical protein
MTQPTARFALLLIFACVLTSLTSAKAATVTWNLSSPSGEQGTTNTLTSVSGGFTIGTAGFTFTGSLTSSPTLTAVDLYGKNTAGDPSETGLGLGNTIGASPHRVDPTGNHEIVTNSLVRIDTTSARSHGVGTFTFSFGSTTQGEGWEVFGSTTANTGLTLIVPQHINDQGIVHALSDYNFYYFVYDGPTSGCGGCNVLLTSFAGTTLGGGGGQGSTPLPAALPMFAGGIGVIGLIVRRKRKKIG